MRTAAVATPAAFVFAVVVVADVSVNVPLAPDVGAVKVTVIPLNT